MTEENKELKSIGEYFYALFSLSIEYKGISVCLWDTSNKKFGNMNFYNRKTDEWYDEKLGNIFYKISKEYNIKSSDYNIITNVEPTTITNQDGDYFIKVENKKPLKIILDINYIGKLFEDYFFEIFCYDENNELIDVDFSKKNGKKQYDGTQIYTIDISHQNCEKFIEIFKWYGELDYNNVTIVYEESFNSFDYKAYKSKILEEIN